MLTSLGSAWLVSYESSPLDVPACHKFGGRRFYGNGDINSYTNYYMNASEKAELNTSIGQIERFLKSGILV